MLPPESAALEVVAREVGIGADTLERWREDAQSRPARGRAWTAGARLEAVITTASMSEAGKSAWCREHGVYPAELDKWRSSCTAALAEPEEARASPQATRQDRKRIKERETPLLTPIKRCRAQSPHYPCGSSKLETHMKALLPVDGSDYTKRMQSYVATHDELLGGGREYTVFIAVSSIPPHAARFLDRGNPDGYHREQAEQVLRPVRAFADQPGWKIPVANAPGHAAVAIAALAEVEKPNLNVMGTHDHSALGNVILGSVASSVLARCKVPVPLTH